MSLLENVLEMGTENVDIYKVDAIEAGSWR